MNPKSRGKSRTTKKLSATELADFRTFLLMRQFAAREIGARIALARKHSGGMTQEELAEVLDVTSRTIQNWESGETIPWRHFQRLEQVFGRDLDWFLHGEEGGRSPSPRVSNGDDRLEEVVDRLERVVEALEGFAASQQRPPSAGTGR